MLVQVCLNSRASNAALVDTQVETVGASDGAQRPNSGLHHGGHLRCFLRAEVVIIRNMAIRTDQQVPCVVGIEVEDGVDQVARSHDE